MSYADPIDPADRAWLETRTSELIATEGMGRVRALAQAVNELIARRRKSAEDQLILGYGSDPREIDRRLRDR